MAELEEIIRLVEQSLDEPGLDAGELASRACLSRALSLRPAGQRATQRSDTMDVLTRMSDHHVELTGAIIDPGAGDPMQFAGGEGSDASGITRNFELKAATKDGGGR